MILHEYETTALQTGWDCTFCGSELEPEGTHYVNPEIPDGVFCTPNCAFTYAEREARRSPRQPGQLGLAL